MQHNSSLDEVGDVLGVVGQVSVHQNNKVPCAVLQSVHVRASQPQLSRAGDDTDRVFTVNALHNRRYQIADRTTSVHHTIFGNHLQLFSDLQRAIRGIILDDHNLVVQLAAQTAIQSTNARKQSTKHGRLLFSEGLDEQPDDKREIGPLVVGRKDHAVFVGHSVVLSRAKGKPRQSNTKYAVFLLSLPRLSDCCACGSEQRSPRVVPKIPNASPAPAAQLQLPTSPQRRQRRRPLAAATAQTHRSCAN